jgi:dimethylaniline monooxygenase (N-oxide forming)
LFHFIGTLLTQPVGRYPQVTDELLEDMELPSMRSGGNWLTWPFKVITVDEVATLTEERRQRRITGSA